MDSSRRQDLKRNKWIGMNPACPEFVPQKMNSGGLNQPFPQSTPWLQPPPPMASGWMLRNHTTWQYLGGHYPPQTRTRGVYLYDLEAVPFDPNIDVPITSCFNCWQTGHPHQRCHLPKSHTFCNNCGRCNVTVDRCARCTRAYHRNLLEIQARIDIGIVSFDQDGPEKGRLTISSELDGSTVKNERFGEKSNCTSVASQVEEGYFSLYGSENFDDIIVDEDLKSDEGYEWSTDFLRDFAGLIDIVKNLPMETQNEVVQQFVAERRQKLEEKDKEKSVYY